MIGLAVNLALNQNFSELMQESDLSMIIDRSLKSLDVCLFKFVKNLCISTTIPEIHETIINFMRHFMKIALTENLGDELKIELIGIFANLRLQNRWVEYLNNQAFLQFLYNHSQTGVLDDDLLLETLQLISSICSEEKCAQIMNKNNFSI